MEDWALNEANIEILEKIDHGVHQAATVRPHYQVAISTKLYLSINKSWLLEI